MEKLDPLEVSDILLAEAKTQLEQAWKECEKMFFRALEDSDKSTVQLVFKVTPDLSEAAPLVTSTLGWKDKAVERGIKVTKSYSSNPQRKELEDPSQSILPLGEGQDTTLPIQKKRGRKKK